MVARRLSDAEPGVEAAEGAQGAEGAEGAEGAQGAHIAHFYAGRSLLITGATGFMGKVLVERLLSTCPDVGRLYLLLRPKRGLAPDQRLAQLKQSQVFDALRDRDPAQLHKLHALSGDVVREGLGLAPADRALLAQVSVVFHSAATLKFDEDLDCAVDQNVRSVQWLMDVCDTLPAMEVFVYVSTAYSNAELTVVEERVYPPPVPLHQLLALARAPPHLLRPLTPRYIAPKPNTYTFTKAMAEVLVQQRKRAYAAAIFRPTIVVAALRSPAPGWVDSVNGPSGVVLGLGKGLLHAFCCRGSARADLLPVDMAIHALLAAAWDTARDRPSEVRVYNCSTAEQPITWHQFESRLRRYLRRWPLDNALWYPSGHCVQTQLGLRVCELLFQTLPLYAADCVTRLLGVNTRINLITASQRLTAMSKVLMFFTTREWQFRDDNMRRLRARLSARDRATFNLEPRTIDWEEHQVNFVKGVRKYLLKEKDQDIEAARRHQTRMLLLHMSLKAAVPVLLLRLLLHTQCTRTFIYALLGVLLSLFRNVCRNLTSHTIADTYKKHK